MRIKSILRSCRTFPFDSRQECPVLQDFQRKRYLFRIYSWMLFEKNVPLHRLLKVVHQEQYVTSSILKVIQTMESFWCLFGEDTFLQDWWINMINRGEFTCLIFIDLILFLGIMTIEKSFSMFFSEPCHYHFCPPLPSSTFNLQRVDVVWNDDWV
jgi:hypothetical protein